MFLLFAMATLQAQEAIQFAKKSSSGSLMELVSAELIGMFLVLSS